LRSSKVTEGGGTGKIAPLTSEAPARSWAKACRAPTSRVPAAEREPILFGARPPAPDAHGAGTPLANSVELTEHGVALAFNGKHRHDLRHCHSAGAWYVWTGTHWARNETRLAFAEARAFAAGLSDGADFKVRATARKAAFAGAVERFAQADPALAVTAEAWDRDPWLLGTPGGTVDLRTGALRPADRHDMITRVTAVAPASAAACPHWLAFLRQATAGDDALVGFLQRWCGCCLTGTTREHALLFIFGPGGNGKSVFLNVVSGILGGYHATAAMDAFTESGSGRHFAFLAMLVGARMLTAAETEEGGAWAETRIKELTGGTPVTANFMRQDPLTCIPQFKITITGNHKPVLRSVDDAARRRFNIVPFLHRPESPDRHLEDRLRQEWPAILRRMIEGCHAWQRDGLRRPEAMAAATEEYFAAQDLFGLWKAARRVVDAQLAERPSDRLTDLNAWLGANGEQLTNRNRFRSWAEKEPGLRYKTVNGSALVAGIGLRLPRVGRVATGGDAKP
jgi:putative DNA primase/helicase